MIFLGYSAMCGSETDYETPNSINNITTVQVENCIVNDLFITSDTDVNMTVPIDTTWDWNTILHATFNGTLLAGNIDSVLDQIAYIRVKYREYGSSDWITLTNVSISTNDDLNFERFCKWCRGGKTQYQFALVPVSPSGVEGNYSINTVVSDFNDLFVMSKDKTFHAINEEITPTRNQDTIILKPLSGKYPVVISNDELNYNTFSVKCMFITQTNNVYDKIGAWKYRDQLKDLLTSKIPLLIKTFDGRMWLISITDAISDDSSNYSYEGYTLTSFNACEIGDANDYDDLINNGLISV